MPRTSDDALPPRLTALLGATAALAVGSVYLPQALVPLIAADLRVPVGTAALVITATQMGYAAGIVLLAPLGDRVAHRTLILVATAGSAAALLVAAAARSPALLATAGFAVGVAAVSAQVVGPLAATLVAPHRRATVIGTLLSGSIVGMFVARSAGGAVAGWLGWRAAYGLAVAAALILLALLFRALPGSEPRPREPYRRLLAAPLRLLRAEPALRRSCAAQAAAFAGFSAVWGSVAILLTGPAFRLGTGALGALALVGALTALCTPYAGRLVDRHGPDAITTAGLLGIVVAAAILGGAGAGGAVGIAALLAGTLLLDVAMQGGMVANVARFYAVRPAERGRMTTAYMTCAYLAGSAGSVLGATLLAAVGWGAVCALVAALALACLVLSGVRFSGP